MWRKVLKLAVLAFSKNSIFLFPLFTVHFFTYFFGTSIFVFSRMQKKISSPQSELFSTHACPACPVSEAGNPAFSRFPWTVFSIFVVLIFVIKRDWQVQIQKHEHKSQLSRANEYHYRAQLIDIHHGKTVRTGVFLALWWQKLWWCNWFGGDDLKKLDFLHFLRTLVNFSPTHTLLQSFPFWHIFWLGLKICFFMYLCALHQWYYDNHIHI